MGTWSILLLATLVACSFLVSGSETALFALSAHDRAAFAVSGSGFKRAASRLMKRPQRVLMTVLIANTAINVAIFAVSYVSLSPESGGSAGQAALGGLIALCAVILFGEIIPKAVALSNAQRIAPIVAPGVELLQWATAPLRGILRVAVVSPITRVLMPPRNNRRTLSAEDVAALVQISAQHAIISTNERDMLEAVVSLPDIAVRSIMVPRVKITAVQLDTPAAEIKRLLAETRLKKIPVYGEDVDDVRGLLYARDLYTRENEQIERLLRPVRFVPEQANLIQLVEHFREAHAQIAVVVDEYGGVAGLVTLEDVLEEVVGEIDEVESERESPMLVDRIDATTYRVAGTIELRPWRRALGLDARFAHVDTIGGAVSAALGRFPRIGDAIHLGNVALTVESLEGKGAGTIRLELDQQAKPAVKQEKQ